MDASSADEPSWFGIEAKIDHMMAFFLTMTISRMMPIRPITLRFDTGRMSASEHHPGGRKRRKNRIGCIAL